MGEYAIKYASPANSAKDLKKALQQAFPATAFSVKLGRGTGYGDCSVSWTDGPTDKRVSAICDTFAGQSFDGMTDRRYSTGATLPDGRPSGLRLINTHRDISASHARKLVQVIATYYGAPEVPEVIETISGWSGKPIWELSFDRPVTDTRDLWTTHLWRAAGDASRYTLTHTEH